MRHLRFALCGLFLLASLAAHGDSIPVFQITSAQMFFFGPGDVAFAFNGPGISVSGQGGFDCPSGWCSGFEVPEGTPIDFTSFVLFAGFTTIQIGGTTYSGAQAVLNSFTMNPLAPLFVPDGGGAMLNSNGLIGGSVNGTFQFEIKVPAGSLELDFLPSVDDPGYYISTGGDFFAQKSPSPVPEPGSVFLLVTGLAGILGTLKIKQRH